MRAFLTILCSAWLALVPITGVAADTADAQYSRVAICADCHGERGASRWPDVPIIGGLSALTLEENLFAFRDGARPCRPTNFRTGDIDRPATDMCKVAADLGDDDIVAVAAYFTAQTFEPAEQVVDPERSTRGAVIHDRVRLHDDGAVPSDNPFVDDGEIAAQVWSLGHRNPLGIAFDAEERLWSVEMGPRGGDELNLIRRGANYGYPVVSEGRHYSGLDIPDHDTRPEFEAPALSWSPVISPASLIFYSGGEFPEWRGDALIASLSGEAVVRVAIDGETATEVERFGMERRIRAVREGLDGALWVLEDGSGRSGGRLLRLTALD